MTLEKQLRNGGDTSSPANLFETVNDCFMIQHVKEFTMVRGGNQPTSLDLLFTYSEYDINNLEYDSPIGRSDHCVLNFEYLVKSQINNA